MCPTLKLMVRVLHSTIFLALLLMLYNYFIILFCQNLMMMLYAGVWCWYVELPPVIWRSQGANCLSLVSGDHFGQVHYWSLIDHFK